MKIILAGHGNIATSMKKSIEMIFGEVDNFYSVEFYKGEGLEDLACKYESLINKDEEVIIIADLFGGSPYNAASMVAMKNESVEVLSGMSLPICLEVAALSNISKPKDIINQVKESVQEYTKSFRDQTIVECEEEF